MNSTRAWVAARAPAWQALATRLSRRPRRSGSSIPEALDTVEDYRGLARDLATAQRLIPATRATLALEALYAQLHALIRRPPTGGAAARLDLFRNRIPRIFAALLPRLGWILALFVLSTAAGWWLVHAYPDLVSLFASQRMIDQVDAGKLWTDDILNITPSSLMSIRIFSNNIAVSIFAVGAGCLFGLGTFYLIATNGLMLGSVFAFVQQHGLGDRLFEFIVAHGPVELSVICIAGAIGAELGDALIRPAAASRRESFQRCAQHLAPLLLLCALLLVGAGCIEGFVSPGDTFPMVSHVVIGVCYWLLMVAALTGRLFGRRPRPARAAA